MIVRGLSSENTNTRHGKPSFELLVRVVQDTPQTTYTAAVAIGCLPEVDSWSLVNTPCASNVGSRGFKRHLT